MRQFLGSRQNTLSIFFTGSPDQNGAQINHFEALLLGVGGRVGFNWQIRWIHPWKMYVGFTVTVEDWRIVLGGRS